MDIRRGTWLRKRMSVRKTDERQGVEYPLEEMLGELMAVQDEMTWALHYIFPADPVAGAIPEEHAARLCREACLCGRGQAQEVKRRFGEAGLGEICHAEKIHVSWDLEDEAVGSVRFAEYIEPSQIRINRTCAERAERLLQELGEKQELGEVLEPGKEQELKKHRISDVLLAHEYYHCLEYRNPGLFTVAYRQKTRRAALFGPARLLALREIGAGAFAAELLGYSYHSSVYDVLLMYCVSPEKACKLYERMRGVLLG